MELFQGPFDFEAVCAARHDAVRTLLMELDDRLRTTPINSEAIDDLGLVLAEAMTNVVCHAYVQSPPQMDASSQSDQEQGAAPCARQMSRACASDASVSNAVPPFAAPPAEQTIVLRLRVDPDHLVAEITDTGRKLGFSLTDARVGKGVPPREGGYGWFLIQSLCTRIDYARCNATNRLRLSVPRFPVRDPLSEDQFIAICKG